MIPLSGFRTGKLTDFLYYQVRRDEFKEGDLAKKDSSFIAIKI